MLGAAFTIAMLLTQAGTVIAEDGTRCVCQGP